MFTDKEDFFYKMDYNTGDPSFMDFTTKHKETIGAKNSVLTKAFSEYKNGNDADLKLLDIGYNLFRYINIDQHGMKFKGKYLMMVVTAIRCSMIGLVMVMVADNYGDVIYVVNCIKSISAFFQGLGKLLPLLIYPEYMIYIRFAAIKFFWKTSCKGDAAENYPLWTKIMRSYQYAIYVMFFFMVLQTVVKRELMFEVYTPDVSFAKLTLLLMQYFQFSTDLYLVVGIDLIFMSSCVIIWRQSKLLLNEFINVKGVGGYEATTKEIRRCLRHHIFFLDYVTCVTETFKYPLLFQYTSSVLGLCIDLYILTENPTPVEMIRSICYLFMLSCQTGLYCFMADYTCEMVENVAVFINDTQWYNNPVYLNKMLLTVLYRAQRDVNFTAGGMVSMNRATFTDIFKTTFSFFTLMRQMKAN